MVKIIDLTDYSMHPAEGVQFYSKFEAEDYIKRNKLSKQFKVEKDEIPDFIARSGWKWKQTYTLRRK